MRWRWMGDVATYTGMPSQIGPSTEPTSTVPLEMTTFTLRQVIKY